MPLKPAVEAELKKLSNNNADEFKKLAELYERYPALQEAFLADADYQRNIQATKAAQKAAEAAEAAAKAQETKNMEWWNNTKATLTTLETENEEYKAKIAELETARGAADDKGATAAQLKKYDATIADLEKKLTANEQFLANLRTQDGKPKALVTEEQLNKSADGFGQFLMDSVDILRKHDRDFPDMALSSRELYKYMIDNKAENVGAAYEKMTADRRQKDWEAKREAEIRKEVLSKMNMPIDTGTSVPLGDGPLKSWINKQNAGKDIPADGSGRLAAAAAAEMRAEGKV